jgi:hypothetical protein
MSNVALPGLNDANPVRQNTAIRQLSERLGDYALTTYVDGEIADEVLARDAAIAVEAADRVAGDATEAAARVAAIATEVSDRNTAIASGVAAGIATREPTIAAGTTSQYWRGDKTWQTFPTGTYVRRYFDSYATYTTLTTHLPADNTVPTSTEGVQIISRSVVTDTSTQRVRLSVSGFGCNSTAGYISVAAFRGTTCVGASLNYNGGNLDHLLLVLEDAPGAAGTYTYSVRVGPGTSGHTVRLNGDLGTRIFGGSAAVVCVTEVLEP